MGRGVRGIEDGIEDFTFDWGRVRSFREAVAGG